LAGMRADEIPEPNPLGIDLVVVPETQHPRETI
jgi:hypothetical protein